MLLGLFITLPYATISLFYTAYGVMIFKRKEAKKKFFFSNKHKSTNVKKQLNHSGLCPITSRLVFYEINNQLYEYLSVYFICLIPASTRPCSFLKPSYPNFVIIFFGETLILFCYSKSKIEAR